MGVLRNVESGIRFTLLHHTLIGRARRCDLGIRRSFVSSEHAVIRYQGGGWMIRDLNSQNGTTVDGYLLAERTDHRLASGARLAFGQLEEAWILEDDAEPTAAAFGPHGVRRDALDGVLALPDDDRLSVTIEQLDDRWLSDDRGERRPVIDGDTLIVDGEVWTLSLPHAITPTQKTDQPVVRVSDLRLHMRVSADGETFETRFEHPAGIIELPHRVHHGVLCQLARYLIDDRAAESVEEGWNLVDTLCEDCDLSRPTLDVYVRRLRQQLFKARVPDAEDLIERRGGKIRLAPIPAVVEPME